MSTENQEKISSFLSKENFKKYFSILFLSSIITSRKEREIIFGYFIEDIEFCRATIINFKILKELQQFFSRDKLTCKMEDLYVMILNDEKIISSLLENISYAQSDIIFTWISKNLEPSLVGNMLFKLLSQKPLNEDNRGIVSFLNYLLLHSKFLDNDNLVYGIWNTFIIKINETLSDENEEINKINTQSSLPKDFLSWERRCRPTLSIFDCFLKLITFSDKTAENAAQQSEWMFFLNHFTPKTSPFEDHKIIFKSVFSNSCTANALMIYLFKTGLLSDLTAETEFNIYRNTWSSPGEIADLEKTNNFLKNLTKGQLELSVSYSNQTKILSKQNQSFKDLYKKKIKTNSFFKKREITDESNINFNLTSELNTFENNTYKLVIITSQTKPLLHTILVGKEEGNFVCINNGLQYMCVSSEELSSYVKTTFNSSSYDTHIRGDLKESKHWKEENEGLSLKIFPS